MKKEPIAYFHNDGRLFCAEHAPQEAKDAFEADNENTGWSWCMPEDDWVQQLEPCQHSEDCTNVLDNLGF